MLDKNYLFKVTIPSVQKFIVSSRKSSDLWAGSFIISYLMKKLLNIAKSKGNVDFIYPILEKKEEKLVANIPNIATFILRTKEGNEALKLKEELINTFNENLQNLVNHGIKKFLDKEIEEITGEDIKKAFKTNSPEEINKIFQEIKNLKNYREDYIDLANFQIKETIKLFIEFMEIQQESDYKKILEDLSYIIDYEKKSQLPNRDCVESYQLLEVSDLNKNETWKDFFSNTKKENFKNLKGTYRCSSCGEHTIIGATLKDWKGNYIWKPIWEANPKIFNRGERLCGVCLVKRYFREILSKELDEKNYNNYLGFPSTSEVGATLFKKSLLDNVVSLNNFLEEIFKNLKKIKNFEFSKVQGNLVPKFLGEINSKFTSDKNLAEENQSITYKILKVDGEWFFKTTWENPNDYKDIGADENIAKQMLKILDELYKFLENQGIEKHYKPSEYYAILMLDGDSIGEKLSLMEKLKDYKTFSETLSKLTKEFKNIVEENYGALVYSGGDDVLALLPMEKALDCAYKIQETFSTKLKENFPNINEKSAFSMSGAIIYAHHKLPLSYILENLRSCEEKAKDEGKNRICLKYIKSSLSSAEITLKWENLKEFKKIPIVKSFIFQLREFKDIFNFKEEYDSISDLGSFGNSLSEIKDIQENLMLSLLARKMLDKNLSKDFIKKLKTLDIHKKIYIKDSKKILKIYDFDKIENLLLVKEFIFN